MGKATGTRRATANDCREPLHYLITADSPFKVDQAKRAIQDVIETATTTPDRDNKRKTEQLRSLAIMNGTFCDYERSKENMLELTDSSENHKKTRTWPCAVWIQVKHRFRTRRSPGRRIPAIDVRDLGGITNKFEAPELSLH